jgi:hypothetical protein
MTWIKNEEALEDPILPMPFVFPDSFLGLENGEASPACQERVKRQHSAVSTQPSCKGGLCVHIFWIQTCLLLDRYLLHINSRDADIHPHQLMIGAGEREEANQCEQGISIQPPANCGPRAFSSKLSSDASLPTYRTIRRPAL